MRILFVSPFLPYPGVPHAGGKLIHYFLSFLARSHSVVLLSRVFPGEELHLPYLSGMLERVETVAAGGPIRAGSLASLLRTVDSYRRLCRRARNLLQAERFDLCQVEFTETGVFWTASGEVPSMLTCHDVIAKPAYRRYLSATGLSRGTAWVGWNARFAMEKHALSKFDRVFTLSPGDREWARRLYRFPIVELLRYPAGIGFTGLPRKETPNRILFVGAMNRPQNEEAVRYFFERCWPGVRETVPGAEFRVAGGGMTERLKGLLSRDPRVTIAGYIENLEEEYCSAAVFVAPILQGGGIIVKILDAMAAGVPTVTTAYGNEGIAAIDGRDLFVADDPSNFEERVRRLLADPELRRGMGKRAMEFVGEYFGPGSLVSGFESVLREIAGSGTCRVNPR